jgi:hypothetical protein
MMRGVGTLLSFVSVMFFPWPLTLLISLVVACFEPLVPLAVGIFADTLFYTPQSGIPLFTVYGLVVTIGALFIRARLRAEAR